MSKPHVYLADLRHTHIGVLSVDSMPLNVGFMKAVMDRDLPEVESRLFVYPDRLLASLHSDPPDVLMLSNYTWNEQLSLHFARLAKRIRPETLVVVGGPNIPDEVERRTSYVSNHPELDLYVLGEGDFLATEIMAQFLDAGMSVSELRRRDIPSSVYLRPDGEVAYHDVRPRQRDLDEIPSPWLNGILDEFFDSKLSPLWETNRGCPFTCTFCVQGTKYYNKVNYFSTERLREEIYYIGRRIYEHSPNMGTLRIADPNFGMYKRDVELSEYIGQVQKKYGWPGYIDATTGKNRADRIITSLEKVSGALVLYQAVQSLDEEVLKNVKRQNIKLDAYRELQVHMRGRGLKSSSDLILGLPGETLKTHLNSLLQLIDSGVTRMNNFQCMLLKGTELDRKDSRERFNFETRYRVVPKSLGVYDGELVFEDEEIVVATDTLSFEDYLRARIFHLACAVFLNHGRLETLLTLAVSLGIKRSELFLAFVNAMEEDEGVVKELVDQFMRETKGEIFETRDAMIEYYRKPENLELLSEGAIGDNLIYKYSAIANLRIWNHVANLALDSMRSLILDRGMDRTIPDFEAFWRDLTEYQRLGYASGTTISELTSPASTVLQYDMPQWVADGFPAQVENYRLPAPAHAEFRLSSAHAKELEQAVNVWGLSQKGATMLIKRIKSDSLARDLTSFLA